MSKPCNPGRWCLPTWLLLTGSLAAQPPAGPIPPPPPGASTGPSLPAHLAQPTRLSVRAWVNNKPIFDQELLNDAVFDLYRIAKMSEPQRSVKRAEILKTHLQRLIENELVIQDAYHKLDKNKPAMDKLKEMAEKDIDKKLRQLRKDVGGEDQLTEWLRIQGMTLESYRARQEKLFIANYYLYSRIGPLMDAIGHPDIREYYEQHQNEFQTVDRVQWQAVFIAVGPKHPTPSEARRFAEELLGRLRQGEDFANLLKYDEGVGSVGQRRGELKPAEVETYLWDMKDGEVGPPLTLPTGVLLFRLVKRDFASQLPLDEKTQAQIRHKLKDEVWDRERKRILRDLSAPERAVIVIESSPWP